MSAASSSWPFGRLRRGYYGALLADPPWTFETYSEAGKFGGAA